MPSYDDEIQRLTEQLLSRGRPQGRRGCFLFNPLWLLLFTIWGALGLFFLPEIANRLPAVGITVNGTPVSIGSAGAASSQGVCKDILNSIEGGIDPNNAIYTRYGENMLVLGTFKSTNSGYWTHQPNGWHRAWDVQARAGSPAQTHVELKFVQQGTNNLACCAGDWLAFEWVPGESIYGKKVYFYYGHLEYAPHLQAGKVYPAGTPIGNTNQFAHVHWHIGYDTDGGPWGEIDNAVWWQQNCIGSVVKGEVNSDIQNLVSAPRVTADEIDQILARWNSPAVGTGQDWVNAGLATGLDPAYAVAFFIHESGAGSNPNWAGYKPDGSTSHNPGNIICAGWAGACYGRFRDYPSWKEGIQDWFVLIDREYVEDRGISNVYDILRVYAPAGPPDYNDPDGYGDHVVSLVTCWASDTPVAECP